jgi:putative transposase
MPGMPIPKAQIVNLSDAERNGLEKLIKRHQVGQQIALRARIVLAAADGQKNKEIAQAYNVTLDTVRLWRNRWVKLQDISLDDLSLEDRLQDAPRPGAPARISADQRCQIEALACEKPEASDRPITHWTAREIADELKKRKIVDDISPRHAARLLKRE